jgi:hypothetical protein
MQPCKRENEITAKRLLRVRPSSPTFHQHVMNILVARSGRHIWQRPLPCFPYLKCDFLLWPRRQASNTAGDSGPDIKKTRNIGIIAHIDAVGQLLFSEMIA